MSHRKTERKYRAETADLFAHGTMNLTVWEARVETFVRAMRIREKVGKPKGHIYSLSRDSMDAASTSTSSSI